MTSALDNPADGAHLALERTTSQMLLWFLGHRVTIGLTAVIVSAGVITTSAVTTGSAPTNQPGNDAPTKRFAPTESAVATTGELTIACAGDARLTFDGSGAGELTLVVDGPATGSASGRDRVEVTVAGPAGSYLGRFTSDVRLDRMS